MIEVVVRECTREDQPQAKDVMAALAGAGKLR